MGNLSSNTWYMVTSSKDITGSVKVPSVHGEISTLNHRFGKSLERWVLILDMKPLEYSTSLEDPSRTAERRAELTDFKDVTYYAVVDADWVSACESLGKGSDLGITCFVQTSTINHVQGISDIIGIGQSYVRKVSLKFSTLFDETFNPVQTIVKVTITGAEIEVKHTPRGQGHNPEGNLIARFKGIEEEAS